MTRRPVAATLAVAFAVMTANAGRAESCQAQAGVPAYELTVRALPDSARLLVSGAVVLPPADSARDHITLVLHAAFHVVHFQLLQPRPGDTLVVTRELRGSFIHWTLRTPRKIPARTRVKVGFSYGDSVQSARHFHVGSDGSYVEVGWYPVDPEFAARDTRATGTITIDVPPGYSAAGTGDRRSTASEAARGHFRFTTIVPRRLGFALGKYSVARHAGRIPITLYSLRDRGDAAAFLDRCARTLEVLEKEFGPYPYRELNIVEVPTAPARNAGFGGRSVNGIVLVTGDNLDQGFNLGFFAHELSHQWWADLIEPHGPDGVQDMLTEAMATYGSLRAVEALEGSAAADQYRAAGYPGFHDSNLAFYLDLLVAGFDTLPFARVREPLAHDLANVKGFRVWTALARELGPERFRSALRGFTRAHAFMPVTWKEFTRAMDAAAGRNLDWFFDQWVNGRTGIPEWHVDWRQDGDTVRGNVTQFGQPFRVTTDVVLAADSAHAVTRTIVLRENITTFAWAVPFPVRTVTVDPHAFIPHWTREAAEDNRALAPAKRANVLDQAGRTAEAFAAFTAGLDSVPTPDMHGLRYLLDYGLGWMNLRASRWQEAIARMQAALSDPNLAASNGQACRAPGGNCSVPWGYYVVARAAQQLGDSVLLCTAVRDAIAADTGARYGAGAQTRALGPRCGP